MRAAIRAYAAATSCGSVVCGRTVRTGQDALRTTVEDWLEAEPSRPAHVPADDWLTWEQDKHERLVAEAARRADTTASNLTETL